MTTRVGINGFGRIGRSFTRLALETEIEGVVPWRRAMTGGAGTIRRATASALESKKLP
jgi:hypothetical protein